jgi:hypothetical protein
MRERWKEIFDGHYAVSSLGRLWRLARHRNGRFASKRFLKGYVMKDGYVVVCLHTRKGQENCLLHCLVAEAFLGPRPPGKEVNHKDGVKQNCSLENLEYLTRKQNHEHAVRLGLKAKGSGHGRAKLTEAMVRKMRTLFSTRHWSMAALARRFGVSDTVVWNVVGYRSWRHVK